MAGINTPAHCKTPRGESAQIRHNRPRYQSRLARSSIRSGKETQTGKLRLNRSFLIFLYPYKSTTIVAVLLQKPPYSYECARSRTFELRAQKNRRRVRRRDIKPAWPTVFDRKFSAEIHTPDRTRTAIGN